MSKRWVRPLAVWAAVVSVLVLPVVSAPHHAAAVTSHEWTGANSTAWSDPGNWSTSEVPQPLDAVTLKPGARNTVDGVPAITLTAFTVQPGTTVRGDGPISAASVTLNGGTIEVSVNADVLLIVQQTDPELPIVFSGAETALTSLGLAQSFGGSRIELLFDADVVNNGTWRLLPGIVSQETTIAVNRCCTGSPGTFDNTGIVDQVGDASILRVLNGVYIGRPSSTVKAPIEIVGGEPRFGGRTQVFGPTGAIRLSNGALLKQLLTAAPTIELRNGGAFSQASGSAITAPVSFTKSGTGTADYDWYSGDIRDAVTIGENVTLRVRNTETRDFRPAASTDALTNRGRIVFHASAEIRLGGRMVNTGTISVEPRRAGSLRGLTCCTDPARVINSGLIAANSTGASLTVSQAALWSVGPDSKLRGTILLDGGVNRLGNGATITGETTRVSQINGGRLNGVGDLTVELGARLSVRGTSTISGANDFTVSGRGRMVWNSGYMVGKMTIGRQATLELSDLASEVDPFRQVTTESGDSVITNNGAVIQRGDLRLAGAASDAVVINAGTWTLERGGVLRWGASLLRNTGTLTVDGATASTVTRWNADRVFTSGRIDVDKGDLFIEPTRFFRQTDGTTNVAKDSVLFVDDDFDLDGGRLTGNGVVETFRLLNDGVVEPSPGKARLRLIGDYRQSARGVLAIEFGATSSSWLSVSKNAYLAGTVRVTTTGRLPVIGTGSEVLAARDRIGTFDDLAGPNASRLRFFNTRDSVIVAAR
jgi:hypothetical protein